MKSDSDENHHSCHFKISLLTEAFAASLFSLEDDPVVGDVKTGKRGNQYGHQEKEGRKSFQQADGGKHGADRAGNGGG